MNTITIRTAGAVLALALASLGTPLFAAEPPEKAQEIVVGAVGEALDYLDTHLDAIKADRTLLESKVDELVVPYVDFLTMTKLSLGKHWRNADAAQQEELVVQFKELLTSTYLDAVTEYAGQTIEFEPFRAEERDDRAVVRSQYKQSGSDDVPVNYRLRENDGWKIYDIEVAGISLVTSFRQQFSAEVDRGGVEGLLGWMREKNAGTTADQG